MFQTLKLFLLWSVFQALLLVWEEVKMLDDSQINWPLLYNIGVGTYIQIQVKSLPVDG